MSQSHTSSSRNLTPTEELEKLEQSITLTLQEIDHNFSRAHRIVTTSILPIVEQYAEHSKAVWEGSKFWKQFFEASANVSLSGYEELATDEDDETALSQSQQDDSAQYAADEETIVTENEGQTDYDQTNASLLEEDISGSTPRPIRAQGEGKSRPSFASYASPYELVKRELKGESDVTDDDADSQLTPTTPRPTQRIPTMSMTPESSPAEPATQLRSVQQRKHGVDPLLHRVLDKNYRLQATPHTDQRDRIAAGKSSWQDDSSPMSSPLAAPTLRSEIFSSPARQQYNRATAEPRTPGVSVQTPAKGKGSVYRSGTGGRDEITWDSDSDGDADEVYKQLRLSPPKTIQFAIAPSRLLQTPAREASKRIVEDLLMTAGAGQDTDLEESPSMVRMQNDLDDSF